MQKRNTVEIISPNLDKKFKVIDFMESFYLKKGYHRYPKNIIINFFYDLFFPYFVKFLFIIKVFKNIKLIFKNPSRKTLLIYDCENYKNLSTLVSDLDYGVISVRIDRIKEIYLTKKVLFYMITNLFRSSLKQNYIISIIKIIKPKIIITNIHNSDDFHLTSKLLKDTNIKFMAVQCSHPTDTVWKTNDEIKKIYIQNFLCFSDYDKKEHENRKCKIDKYFTVGSLNVSLALNHAKTNKIITSPELYDICLISEPVPIVNGDYAHVENLQESLGKIAEYTHRLAKEENLKIIFSGKYFDKENVDIENHFYKNFLKDYNFNIVPQNSSLLSTYINMMKSKIIVGHISTVLREAFALKKKVLVCKFTGHKDVIFPSDGICIMEENTSYEEFKTRVKKIIQMNYQDYLKNLSQKEDYIIDTRINTSKFIRMKIDETIKFENK